jgi:hypothetical protein
MDERINDTAFLCAIGIMFLMLALGSAIWLGTSHLIAPGDIWVQTSSLMMGMFLVAGFSLLGGYLVSSGFIKIFREQEEKEKVQLE